MVQSRKLYPFQALCPNDISICYSKKVFASAGLRRSNAGLYQGRMFELWVRTSQLILHLTNQKSILSKELAASYFDRVVPLICLP